MSQKQALGFICMFGFFMAGAAVMALSLGAYRSAAVVTTLMVVLFIAGEAVHRDMI